jgi:two-component system OmpR family sensor kinase
MTKLTALRRRLRSRLPIRWRLALVSFGLFALLLAALGLQIAYTEEQTLLSNQAIALREHVRLAPLSQALPVAPTPLPPIGPFPQSFPGELPDLRSGSAAEELVQLFSGPTIRATVISSTGSMLASSGGNTLAPPPVSVSRAAVQRALTAAPQLADYLLTPDNTGQRQLIVLLPIVVSHDDTASSARTVGVLALSTPTAPIDGAVATTRLDLIPGIGVSLAIAAAVILPLMRIALRPLTEIERASTQIAQGALSLRIKVPPTRDEIGRLASAFNSMVAQLEAAFAHQKQFVADASHELRTPITVLSGNLEMLLLGMYADRQTARRLLQNMYAEVERMRRLVEDLLTLTRVDEGRIQLHTEPIDLAPFCAELCEQAQQLSNGQTIECEVTTDLPAMCADRDRLRQVLLNVLDNAFKYTPAGGHIRLAARQVDRGILIEVHDTGVGIPPEALPYVFQRFYRADPARGRAAAHKGGAGLGLAIARSLVEAQGGQMSIASEPGQGTIVTIQLPSAQTPDAEGQPNR